MSNMDLNPLELACQRFSDELVALGVTRARPPIAASGENRSSIFGNEADAAWGYRFGCDGLMNAEQAAAFLAISERKLDEHVASKHIRKGRMPGSRLRHFCKRSVVEFAQSIES